MTTNQLLSEMPVTTATLSKIAAMLNKFRAKGKTSALFSACNVLEREQPALYADMLEIYKSTNFGALIGLDSTCILEFSEKTRKSF